jgi:multicomponent K+:H+ antiporter subunit E
VRSNVAVARVVVRPASRRGHAAFVDIPLELRNPAGLAALACIITSTPGTAWSGYDRASGVLTLHVLDLIDVEEMRRTIKERYERPLMEIFA